MLNGEPKARRGIVAAILNEGRVGSSVGSLTRLSDTSAASNRISATVNRAHTAHAERVNAELVSFVA
jgi:hypothetical protein